MVARMKKGREGGSKSEIFVQPSPSPPSQSPYFNATFRFYAELNDFLPPDKRQKPCSYGFTVSPAVKDVIEALGVPHPEVDLILVNGESVDFSYLIQDGDQVSVYPVFESIDITPLVRVRPKPLRETRFVLDVHLGRLATYLRMLGFDTLYQNDYSDETLAEISSQEGRILLTRDRGLLKRSIVTHGYCLRATNPRHQLIETLHRFDLFKAVTPFQRCLHCNHSLQTVNKETIVDRLLPHTRQNHHEFRYCQNCDRIYWQGSHYQRMQQFIKSILEEEQAEG